MFKFKPFEEISFKISVRKIRTLQSLTLNLLNLFRRGGPSGLKFLQNFATYSPKRHQKIASLHSFLLLIKTPSVVRRFMCLNIEKVSALLLRKETVFSFWLVLVLSQRLDLSHKSPKVKKIRQKLNFFQPYLLQDNII